MTVVDVNGCADVESAMLMQPNVLIVDKIQTDVSCFGNNQGMIDLTVSGGTAPYQYLWSDGITTQDRTNLLAGNYTVTVTDNKFCQSSKTIAIQQPNAALNLSVSAIDISCFGLTNGTLNLTVSGEFTLYLCMVFAGFCFISINTRRYKRTESWFLHSYSIRC